MNQHMHTTRLKFRICMRSIFIILTALLFCSCATSYGGKRFVPGKTTMHDVLHTMGNPAMRWENPDGSTQLVYARGPVGYNTFMVSIGKDQKLQNIEDVLNPRYFSLIQPGMTKDQVLHTLGPSEPSWTRTFNARSGFIARNDLIWEWRYCSAAREASRFAVVFDNRTGMVRSTSQEPEDCGEEGWRCRCP